MPTMGRAGSIGRTKQMSLRISEESHRRLSERKQLHRLSLADIVELVIWHMSDDDLTALAAKDRQARFAGSGAAEAAGASA